MWLSSEYTGVIHTNSIDKTIQHFKIQNQIPFIVFSF